MLECLVVGMGGFLGSVLRYLIGKIPVNETMTFPIKTFAINLIGSFIIGILAALSVKYSSLNPRLVLFLKVGFCGGFTTFSTFALETSDLMQKGQTSIAVVYAVLSAVLGVLCVIGGQALIEHI